MATVTVTSSRTTVYTRAHRTAEVELTPRVQHLIDRGVLALAGDTPGTREPSATVPDVEPFVLREVPEVPRAELAAEAGSLGVAVRPSWSRAKIRREIDAAQAGSPGGGTDG